MIGKGGVSITYLCIWIIFYWVGSDNMSNIKNYRSKELLWYIIGQIFIIIICQNPNILFLKFSECHNTLVKIISSTMFSSILAVFVFVFDAMFDDESKDICLYFGGCKPGECVFEDIKTNHKDYRYTKEKAMEVYKEIYMNMPDSKVKKRAYENEQWYKIYDKHRDVSMVKNSHRDYLLCRDVYFLTIVMLAFYVLISLLLNSVVFSLRLFAFEILLLIISNIAARQRGKRYVANVIAYDIYAKTKEISFYGM